MSRTEHLLTKSGVGSPATSGLTASPMTTEATEIVWDVKALLRLSDTIRASLADGRPLGLESDDLSLLLDALIADEMSRTPAISFETIERARLDKLLEDIQDPAKKLIQLSVKFQSEMSKADTLQRMWRTRFKGQYFTIDQWRYEALLRKGRLKDIAFSSNPKDGLGVWIVNGNTLEASELDGSLHFDLGR